MSKIFSLGFIAFVSTGCLATETTEEPQTSEISSEIKAKKKMFVTLRVENSVAVFDSDGARAANNLVGSGIRTPFGVHAERNDIYVVSQATNEVFAHLHSGGEKEADHNKLSVLVTAGSQGLAQPFYPMVRDGVLFVSSGASDEVLTYDAETGAPAGVFASRGAGGIDQPRGIDFDDDGNAYVASFLTNSVKVFDESGNYLRDLAAVPNPCGVTINEDDTVCVGSATPGTGGVYCYDTDGTSVYRGPLVGPVCGLDFGPDGRVYATRPPLNAIQAHDITTGAIETFATAQNPAGTPSIAGVSWGLRQR